MTARVITVTSAQSTLFHVAAREMGNALGAVRIARASGITDPWLDGLATVTIPALGPDTGGLPAPGAPST